MTRKIARRGPILLSSREAAGRLGVGTSTLNRWADEGRIHCQRTAGGHRRFHPTAVQALLDHQQGGVSALPSTSWADRFLAASDVASLRADLLRARSRLGSWGEVADSVAPGIVELGERWARGELSVVAEHLASARLSRALAAIVEALPVSPEAPVVLLATPESEEHTLGLALAEVCAREAGLRTHWIGARTPPEALAETILRTEDLACVTISASAFSQDPDLLRKIVAHLAQACDQRGAALIVGGSGAWPEPMPAGSRLRSYTSYSALLARSGARPLLRRVL
ncbi:MAG: excisionase family DNA-binding protein [Deltaproteobacteria bacterium]|nr:excisionase family DNA-binding protein [Deltaproteobacteria bacterium]